MNEINSIALSAFVVCVALGIVLLLFLLSQSKIKTQEEMISSMEKLRIVFDDCLFLTHNATEAQHTKILYFRTLIFSAIQKTKMFDISESSFDSFRHVVSSIIYVITNHFDLSARNRSEENFLKELEKRCLILNSILYI